MPYSTLLERIRSEYLELPGLCLTVEQAQRLFAVERAACQEALDALMDMKFLGLTARGGYARPSARADALLRLYSVPTAQLKVQLDRRGLPHRRLTARGGRRANDHESVHPQGIDSRTA